MLVFHTNRYGKPRQIDVHNLPLGRSFCHKMTGPDLHAALEQLGVDGIDRTMGHQDLSIRYGCWLAEQSEKDDAA
jgi:hypothetical protein